MTTGILEQILASVQATQAMVQAMQQQAGSQQPAPPVDPAAAERARLEAQLAALNGGTQQQQPAPPVGTVTSDQLMALITPHLDNAAVKEALGGAMRAAGINALPEAQPHQYADLYARFQAVIAQHGGAAASTGNASII